MQISQAVRQNLQCRLFACCSKAEVDRRKTDTPVCVLLYPCSPVHKQRGFPQTSRGCQQTVGALVGEEGIEMCQFGVTPHKDVVGSVVGNQSLYQVAPLGWQGLLLTHCRCLCSY